MSLSIVAEPLPLNFNSDGVVYVSKTRVTLDTVVTAFQKGMTAEEIVQRYPSLNLADVYAVIAFYLNHKEDVEAYLENRQLDRQNVRQMNQAHFDTKSLRDRLLARKAEK